MRGTGDNARGRPATVAQLLVVDAIVVLALGVYFARPHYPRWVKPEFVWNLQAVPPLSVELPAPTADADTLVVGDSMVASWPKPVVKIAQPGWTTDALRARLQEFFETADESQPAFRRIVLWPGTWDTMQFRPPEDYVDDALEMVEVARRHAKEVVLLTPMPPAVPTRAAPEQEEQVSIVVAASRRLRQNLPEDVILVDMVQAREFLEDEPDRDKLFLDNLHVSRDGIQVLTRVFVDSQPPRDSSHDALDVEWDAGDSDHESGPLTPVSASARVE